MNNIDMDELDYMLGWSSSQPKIATASDPTTLLSSDVYHEDKIAKVLNKYFGDKWVEYSIEEKTLDRISTEITLTVVFKNNRKSNITLPVL